MPKEEADLVGDLRYSWRKLRRLAGEVSERLAQLQLGFRRQLLGEVRAFVTDAVAFRQDWEASGPTVAGLDPMEASDRLRKFQQLFEVRASKGAGGREQGGREQGGRTGQGGSGAGAEGRQGGVCRTQRGSPIPEHTPCCAAVGPSF